MQSDSSDQHQNMPDPLEFKPGDKTPSNFAKPADVNIKSKVKLGRYMMPMIVNLVLYTIVQTALRNSCNNLPDEQKGECGAAWINFMIVLPLEVLVFSICLIIMLIGLTRWSKG